MGSWTPSPSLVLAPLTPFFLSSLTLLLSLRSFSLQSLFHFLVFSLPHLWLFTLLLSTHPGPLPSLVHFVRCPECVSGMRACPPSPLFCSASPPFVGALVVVGTSECHL